MFCGYGMNAALITDMHASLSVRDKRISKNQLLSTKGMKMVPGETEFEFGSKALRSLVLVIVCVFPRALDHEHTCLEGASFGLAGVEKALMVFCNFQSNALASSEGLPAAPGRVRTAHCHKKVGMQRTGRPRRQCARVECSD